MENKVQLQVTIAASPRDVYHALTEGDQLTQWFSEYADVSVEDNRYDFWGRLTPETPDRAKGQHKLLAADPDEGLKFEWSLRGNETSVNIDLKEQGPNTMLKLVHFGLPTRQPGQFAVADFWSLSIENLRAWVERKSIGTRCDFGSIRQGEVHLDIDIEAPPEAVFETLIDPEKIKRYMNSEPTVEPEVGGRYDFGWEDGGPVKILDLTPNEKLSYRWEYKHEPETVVTWKLEGSGGKTHLTLVHSGFASDRNLEGYNVGWMHFLNRIKFLSELGNAWQKAEISTTDH